MAMQKEIMSGLKWYTGAKFAAQGVTWAITLIVIRLLTPEDYGLLAMAMVFISFMLMFAEAGLAPALVQKEKLDETSQRQAFGIIIGINLGLLIILNLFSPLFAGFFDDKRLIPILHVMSLQFVFIIFSTIPEVLLNRALRFKNLSLINVTCAVLNGVMTLALAFAHFGVWALILGNLFGSFTRLILLNIIAPFYKWPIFSLRGMRRLLSFGGNITLSRFLWMFLSKVDIIIVGKLLGQEILGLYSVAKQLAALPVQRISAIVNQVIFPVFSHLQGDRKALNRILIKAMRALGFISFPVLWGISCTANEIVLLFLGEKWQYAIFPLMILALTAPLRMMANILPAATDAVERPDITMSNVLIVTFISPPAIFIGASQWGLIGVIMTGAILSPMMFFITTYRSFGVLGLRLRDLIYVIAPVVVSAIGMYIIVWNVSWLLDGHVSQIAKFIVMVVAGALTYGILTLILNRQGYHEVLNFIRQR